MTAACFELLPEEVILMILEQLKVPESYDGCFIPNDHHSKLFPFKTYCSLSNLRLRSYLRDIIKLSATCKQLRQVAGPFIWGHFVYDAKTDKEWNDDYTPFSFFPIRKSWSWKPLDTLDAVIWLRIRHHISAS